MKSTRAGSVCLGVLFSASTLGLSCAAAQSTAPVRSDVLEELIVTAQKRSQRIQDVPLSVTAYSGETLQELGIKQTTDLMFAVPGLNAITTQGDGNPTFTIRGIGLNDFSTNNNPNVSVYVDDVILPYTPMLTGSLFDVDRVEVLKGPQGTLYGRNTTGGAVKFVSRRPTDEPSANYRLDVGDYGLIETELGIGGPLSDTLSYRVAGIGTYRDRGWQTNIANNENVGKVKRGAMRAQLLWKPQEKLDVLFNVHGSLDDSENQLPRAREHQTLTGATCASSGQYNDPNCVVLNKDGEIFKNNSDDVRLVAGSSLYGNVTDTHAIGASVVANYHLDPIVLTSISAFDYSNVKNGYDPDGTPYILLDSSYGAKVHAYSQEFRATGDTGPVEWTGGIYLSYDRNVGYVPQALDDKAFGRTRVLTTWTQRTKSAALFGQAEWAITDQLSVIGGLRGTQEKKEYDYSAYDLDPFGTSSFAAIGFHAVQDYFSSIDNKNLSWKAGINYKITPDVLAYASASKGFKSGGYKAAIQFNVAELQPFDPEMLYAYEVGLKSSWFDNELIVNLAGYYYDWQSYQATGTVCSPICVTTLTNVGDAEIKGFETDITWRPSGQLQGLSLSLGSNIADATVKTGPYAGNRLARTPKFSLNGVVRYQAATGFGKTFGYGQLAGYHQSAVDFTNENFPQQREGSYAMLDLRFGLTQPDDGWDIGIWVKNLTDKVYRTAATNPLGFIPNADFYGAPRTFGVSFSRSY